MSRAETEGRRGSRRQRLERKSGGLPQRPFKQLVYRYPPIEIISADEVEAIHEMGLTILEEVGMKVLSGPARAAYRAAGFSVDEAEQRVRFDRAGAMGLVAHAPSSFLLTARNPSKSIRMGDGHAVFCSVGGPAFSMDLEHGRRDGSFAAMQDFMKVVQSLDILHQEGGGGFEPLDLPPETRHLDIYLSCMRLLDKCWVPWTLGRAQTLDAIEMGAIVLGKSLEEMVETPMFSGIINTNSPLQLDVPMAEGLMTLAEYGQVNVVTPFTLAGAMAPVTLAGALAQQHAEAIAGIALAQIVRKGVPVVYGGFTSNVDMKTGSPAFGTPEYTQAAQVSGQLARRLGLPYRSSNVTSANTTDAQAAYESQMALWGAMLGQANMIKHAAGWVGGGLTGSFEKLIIDAEMLQMMAAWLEPFAVDDGTLALDAIKEVGPAGHYFGTKHTIARYETAFYQPLLSNWDNYDNWRERGQVTAEQRANQIWKELVASYEQPPLDPAVDEALGDYAERRRREITGRKP
ncbi:MAG: trimethylamine methyltransferase family protein [Hyphomicrobiaceae bacterium]